MLSVYGFPLPRLLLFINGFSKKTRTANILAMVEILPKLYFV